MKSHLSTKVEEARSLEEDNQRWKARTQQILAKYERIDPVEHQKLKDDVSSLQAKLQNITAVLTQTQTALETTQADLQKAISDRERQLEMEKKYRALLEKKDSIIRQKEEELKTKSVASSKDLFARMVIFNLFKPYNPGRKSTRPIPRHYKRPIVN